MTEAGGGVQYQEGARAAGPKPQKLCPPTWGPPHSLSSIPDPQAWVERELGHSSELSKHCHSSSPPKGATLPGSIAITDISICHHPPAVVHLTSQWGQSGPRSLSESREVKSSGLLLLQGCGEMDYGCQCGMPGFGAWWEVHTASFLRTAWPRRPFFSVLCLVLDAVAALIT